MTVTTQNHIRDTISIAIGLFASVDIWADKIAPLAAISPYVAHAYPFFIAAIPMIHSGLGIIFREYNVWDPPIPESTKGTPSNP